MVNYSLSLDGRRVRVKRFNMSPLPLTPSLQGRENKFPSPLRGRVREEV
jgi:hypothetical protein